MTTKSKPRIADRDLMRYLDDEVDDEERARIDEALADDESAEAREARDKLAGLRLASELVRASVNADERADNIADAVMAKLDAPVDAPAKDEIDQAAARENAKIVPLERRPRLAGAPANDNNRTIWTLAAVAAAVAAGLFVWSTSEPDMTPVARTETTEAPVEAEEMPPEPAPPPAPVAVAPSESDDDAVEIAKVEFGASQTGSLFKVGNANTGTATAVVWVTTLGDDE